MNKTTKRTPAKSLPLAKSLSGHKSSFPIKEFPIHGASLTEAQFHRAVMSVMKKR